MVGLSGPIAPEFTGGVPNWAGPEGSPGLTGREGGGTELLAVGGVTISTGGADMWFAAARSAALGNACVKKQCSRSEDEQGRFPDGRNFAQD